MFSIKSSGIGSASSIARRWESALLVNVDKYTLQRLMNSQEAMDALMRIEGFRTLNQDIETIINKSEAVQKAKKEARTRTQCWRKARVDLQRERV